MNILIGIVTHQGHQHCRQQLAQFLSKQQDIFIVTNSGEEDKQNIQQHIPQAIILIDNTQGNPIDKIVHGRNLIRKYFLENNYTHLFMLDSDVIPNSNALTLLQQHNHPLTTGWYLNIYHKNGRQHIKPVVYGPKPGYFCRQLSIKEVLTTTPFPIVMAGLGCCLIKREVLEKIEFRQMENIPNGGEDTAFFVDAKKHNYTLLLDPNVRCNHLHYPKDDERAPRLNPANYKQEHETIIYAPC